MRTLISSYLGITSALSLGACASAPKPLLIVERPETYDSAFSSVKKHILKCYPGVKLRSNLYTDVPEAEIILDYIPGATMIGMSTSYEASREVFHLKFVGEGAKSIITATNQSGLDLVSRTFLNQPCPKK